MSGFENLLDEMHPCCIKELENERRKSEIGKELRGSDRSFIRLDEFRRTFFDVKDMCRLSSRFNCGCCGDSVDYPILAQMRSTRLIAVDEEKDEEKSEGVDVGDEDFDFDDDGIMDSMRQQMAAQIEQVEHLRQEAAVLGFVQHREDSAEHLIELITRYRQPVVLHMYDPTSSTSAQIDLAFEAFAEKYIGTKFRRINIVESTLIRDRFKFARETGVFLFRNANFVSAIKTGLIANYANDDIRLDDLLNFIEHSGVLSTTITADVLMHIMELSSISGKASKDLEEEDRVVYCEEVGCGKRFPHEHVGRRGHDVAKMTF